MSIDCTEICPDLGACCRIFACGSPNGTRRSIRKTIRKHKFPFVEVGKTARSIITRCRRLQPNGKCSEYETRPDTCSGFQPYTDGLCCLFVGPPPPHSIKHSHPELHSKYRHSNVPAMSL